MKNLMILVIIIGWIGCLAPPPIKIGIEGKKLPSLTFLLPDSTTRVYTDSIKEGKPFAMFFYNPDCPFCKAQIRDILKNEQPLKNISIYLMTNYDAKDVKQMINDFELEKYSNITPGIYHGRDWIEYFYIQKVPYLAIFNKEKRLKEVFLGRTDIDLIKNSILNTD